MDSQVRTRIGGGIARPVAARVASRPVADAAPGHVPQGLADRLTELLIKYRWATVVPLVLPLSKAYETYWQLRHVKLRNLFNQPKRHAARVADVQRQVRAFIAAGRRTELTRRKMRRSRD